MKKQSKITLNNYLTTLIEIRETDYTFELQEFWCVKHNKKAQNLERSLATLQSQQNLHFYMGHWFSSDGYEVPKVENH